MLVGLSDDDRDSSVRGLSRTKSTCKGDDCVALVEILIVPGVCHNIALNELTVLLQVVELPFLLILRRL